MERSSFSLAVVVALAVAGCGAITGLSDDYVYVDSDAGGDSGSTGDSDASTSDGSSGDSGSGSSDAGTDPKQSCSDFVQAANAAPACRVCLPKECCDVISTCTHDSDCSAYLECVLKCSALSGDAERRCKNNCDARTKSATRSSLADAIDKCSTSNCQASCGF